MSQLNKACIRAVQLLILTEYSFDPLKDCLTMKIERLLKIAVSNLAMVRIYQRYQSLICAQWIVSLVRNLIDDHVFRNDSASHDLIIQINVLNRVRRDIGGHVCGGLLSP